MEQLRDEDILAACKKGERGAFNHLVRAHQEGVFRVVRRMVQDSDDALDITQDVFIRAYESIDTFRGDAKIFTWLYKIAMNLSLNHLRKRKLRTLLRLSAEHDTLHSDVPSPHRTLEVHELRALIETAIRKLPDKQRAVFVLRYYEELPYEEIASLLNTSVGGLKANYHHAVRKIEEYVRHEMS